MTNATSPALTAIVPAMLPEAPLSGRYLQAEVILGPSALEQVLPRLAANGLGDHELVVRQLLCLGGEFIPGSRALLVIEAGRRDGPSPHVMTAFAGERLVVTADSGLKAYVPGSMSQGEWVKPGWVNRVGPSTILWVPPLYVDIINYVVSLGAPAP